MGKLVENWAEVASENQMKNFIEKNLCTKVETISKIKFEKYGTVFYVTFGEPYPDIPLNEGYPSAYFGDYGLLYEDPRYVVPMLENDFSSETIAKPFFKEYLSFMNGLSQGYSVGGKDYKTCFSERFNWYILAEKRESSIKARDIYDEKRFFLSRLNGLLSQEREPIEE